jgi:threonine/homoserine/homoserine lactone efflux protein
LLLIGLLLAWPPLAAIACDKISINPIMFSYYFLPFLAIVMAVCAFTLTNLPSVSLWAIFGANMRRFLQDARKRRWFNWGMAVALIATLVPMLKF